jgi:hypothetical protein
VGFVDRSWLAGKATQKKSCAAFAASCRQDACAPSLKFFSTASKSLKNLTGFKLLLHFLSRNTPQVFLKSNP